MIHLFRLLRKPVAPALLALVLAAPAFADSTLPLDAPDPYGSFLAGQQALKDLSGSDAERYLRDATATQWNVPAVVQQAFIADLTNGDIERAAATAAHLGTLVSDDALGRLVIAAVDLRGRRYHAVERELADAGSGDFADISGAVFRAWAFIADGREADAYAALDKIGKDGLGDFLAFHHALMADVAGDTNDAISLITQAYGLDSSSPRTVEAYARIYGNAGRFDEALAAIRKFDLMGAGDPGLDAVAKALNAHQRPGPYVANVQAGAGELMRSIAIALARDNNNALAVGLLQIGLYLDPHNDGTRLLIGQLLDAAGQNASANAYYAGVPSNSPFGVTAAVRIARNYDTMGNRPEALRQLTNLADTNPRNVMVLSVLADLLRNDKQYDKAAALYTQAISADAGTQPTDWLFYYERGIAYERAGHWDQAQPDFLKALQLNPGQPDVLNYLGYTWVDRGQNLDQALNMIQQAVKATPGDGFIVDSLGWAYYRLGRFADAVSTLEQAVQLKPNDPQINDHLGDAYWKDGRKLEAHFQWNIAASLDPDPALKASLGKKQANGLDDATAAAVPADLVTSSSTSTQ